MQPLLLAGVVARLGLEVANLLRHGSHVGHQRVDDRLLPTGGVERARPTIERRTHVHRVHGQSRASGVQLRHDVVVGAAAARDGQIVESEREDRLERLLAHATDQLAEERRTLRTGERVDRDRAAALAVGALDGPLAASRRQTRAGRP